LFNAQSFPFCGKNKKFGGVGGVRPFQKFQTFEKVFIPTFRSDSTLYPAIPLGWQGFNTALVVELVETSGLFFLKIWVSPV